MTGLTVRYGWATDDGAGIRNRGRLSFHGAGQQRERQPGRYVLVLINPQRAPLTNNGGQTPTHALLTTNPVLNTGSTTCWGLTSDQCGNSRPSGRGYDIGAFEL